MVVTRKIVNVLRRLRGYRTSKAQYSAALKKPMAPSRSQPTSPRSVVTFGICLASARTVNDWEQTCQLLSQTLTSVLRQTDDRFRVVICGHEVPQIEELSHDAVEFLELSHPAPSRTAPPATRRNDKTRKRMILGGRLRELGGGYFMQLDADDLVHADLVKTVLEAQSQNGFVIDRGFVWDCGNDLVAPVPGAWSFGLSHVSGSTSVVFYLPEDLPTSNSSSNNPLLFFNMTRQHNLVRVAFEETGRRLDQMALPAVIYSVNHGGNLSFQIQKSGRRASHIIDRIAEHAVRDPDYLSAINGAFGISLPGAADNPAASGTADLADLFANDLFLTRSSGLPSLRLFLEAEIKSLTRVIERHATGDRSWRQSPGEALVETTDDELVVAKAKLVEAQEHLARLERT